MDLLSQPASTFTEQTESRTLRLGPLYSSGAFREELVNSNAKPT